MIAACPMCGARYRIDAAKLRSDGARLRCTRCEAVFRVQAAAGAEATQPPPTTQRPAAPAPAPVSPAPQHAASEKRDRERLVLVASPEEEAGKAIVSALSSWNLHTILVHDGVEAILNIQRALPRAVILDAALPKMFGFQVCELMKRNECLREIKVVLVGAIHDQTRYRRPPEELYGADAYTERHQVPDSLRAHLERFGLLAAPAPGAAAQAPPVSARRAPAVATPAPPPPVAPAPAAAPAETPQPPAPGPAVPASEASQAHEKAARLARIIVSDIVLYNQKEFDAAVRTGNVLEALAPQLAEGHALFAERIDPSVGNAQDFLSQELLRIARSKGMNT